jgi:hypothetical protein
MMSIKESNNQTLNCNRNMNKKLIRLTESDLHRIVKESVQKLLVKGSENKTVKEDIGYTGADEPSSKPQIGTPWSEYDEVMLGTAKRIIWDECDDEGTMYKVIDWLKSLKNRVQ